MNATCSLCGYSQDISKFTGRCPICEGSPPIYGLLQRVAALERAQKVKAENQKPVPQVDCFACGRPMHGHLVAYVHGTGNQPDWRIARYQCKNESCPSPEAFVDVEVDL